jgi:hypothetical protein
MQKSTIIALCIGGLLIAIGAIYLYSSYEEPIQAAQDSSSSDSKGGGSSDGGSTIAGMDMPTFVQTTFFAITGLASIGIAVWIIIISRKRIMIQQTPYIVAAAGSSFLILFYIVSRTISLPIVGIQTDIGSIDIITKVLQGIVAGLSVYLITICRNKIPEEIKTR